MIVVDASVLGPIVATDSPAGDSARARLAGESLVAPDLIYLEVLSMIRKELRRRRLTAARAAAAVESLVTLDIETTDHRALTARIWELRDNLTAYDAVYVALAEERNIPLLTMDARLSRASGPRCEIELIRTHHPVGTPT